MWGRQAQLYIISACVKNKPTRGRSAANKRLKGHRGVRRRDVSTMDARAGRFGKKKKKKKKVTILTAHLPRKTRGG